MDDSTPITAARIGQTDTAVDINASLTTVWTTLVERIGSWWPAEFYAGGTAGARSMQIEAWPGGRMMETWEEGGGLLWGTVASVTPDSSLQVLGATFPDWGGPALSCITWQLTGHGHATRLELVEGVLGRVSAGGLSEKHRGWHFLCLALKACAEGTPPPVWQD